MSTEPISWATVVYRSGVVIAMQPVEYAKTLIQIGHEPVPPKPTRTWLGRPALGLPGVFQYIGFIRRRDGFLGLYRGLGPKICESIITAMAYVKVSEAVVFEAEINLRKRKGKKNEEDAEEEDVSDSPIIFACSLARHTLARSASIIVSQPFHVIVIRILAQFVGQESKYSGLFGSAMEIYNESGLVGFFKGLVPRLTGELLSIFIASTLSFTLNTYVVKDPRSKGFITAVSGFVASTLTYPFHVVSTCMSVTGCGLQAGMPPNMPIYVDWTDCWHHLARHNQLKRGSSLLWRYYSLGATKPQTHNFELSQFALPSRSS